MAEIDLVKVIAIILTMISILVGILTFIAITLPGKIKDIADTKVEESMAKFEEVIQAKISILDIMLENFPTPTENNKSITDKLYAVKHTLRISSGTEEEKITSLRALQGMGKDAAFVIPFIERLKRNSDWDRKIHEEYSQFLKRIQ